jgi:hypothetical protein
LAGDPTTVRQIAHRRHRVGVGVLIHCLTLKFKESASAAEIEAFRDALAALPDQVDFPIRTRQGRDLGERPSNADYAVVTEFENTEDFSTYLKHPAHLAVPRDHVESIQSVQFLVDEQG